MSKKPETKFVEQIKKDLMLLPECWFYKTQEVSKRGIPDIVICLSGTFVAIEAKKSIKDQPDALQLHTLENIADCWGIAMVACPENWKESFVFLQKLSEKIRSQVGSEGETVQ
jgi:hypothetical protein